MLLFRNSFTGLHSDPDYTSVLSILGTSDLALMYTVMLHIGCSLKMLRMTCSLSG